MKPNFTLLVAGVRGEGRTRGCCPAAPPFNASRAEKWRQPPPPPSLRAGTRSLQCRTASPGHPALSTSHPRGSLRDPAPNVIIVPSSLPPRGLPLQVSSSKTPQLPPLRFTRTPSRNSQEGRRRSLPPDLSLEKYAGRDKTDLGRAPEHRTARAPRPATCTNSCLSSLRGAPTSGCPKRLGSLQDVQRSPPGHTCPLPAPFPAEPGVRAPGIPAAPIRHPGRASGVGGRVLRPGALFTTRNKSAPSSPGWGIAAGSWPTPAAAGEPQPPSPRHVQPTLEAAWALPSGLGVRVPAAPIPALCPGPTSPLAGSGSQGSARSPAPSLHQPSSKLPNSLLSYNFGARGTGRRGWCGRARADTYRLLERSGPEPPGWAAAFQRSTVERQVKLHDWGGARGASRGADPGAEGPVAARTKRRRRGLRGHSPPGQPPGAAVSPQDRPQGVKLGLSLRWTLHR
ncbi:collagen alpha-1(I) chain-like [Cynocephalus volans]|uniref:collagen alpha-1(I) chain-like n=1 Tax=Cynocephalus volans TaxID=110931 RepID=UPI002FC793D0